MESFFFSAKTAVEFRNLKISKILNNIPNGIFPVPFKVMYISLWCTVSRSGYLFPVTCLGWTKIFLDKYLNPIQDGPLSGCLRIGCKKTLPLQILSHISYNDETCHCYTLPKEDPKTFESHDSLSSADISIFSPVISKFCCIKKYSYRLHLIIQKLIL